MVVDNAPANSKVFPLSKENCIQGFRDFHNRLTAEFVEINIVNFRKLSGSNRKVLIDLAVTVERKHPNPTKDPIREFFMNEYKTLPKTGTNQFCVQSLSFLTEEMHSDFEHYGMKSLTSFQTQPGRISFTGQGSGNLHVRLRGEGILEAEGSYQNISKCYHDFKETSVVGSPYNTSVGTFTPETVRYFIGKKLRTVNFHALIGQGSIDNIWAVRVNIFRIECGTVSIRKLFTHLIHPNYEE